jgi:phytoene desaturase
MCNKTVIIVGAGIGGIATSIALANKGFRVSIYEKRSIPGGRCGHFTRDGHRFDIGATLVLMPSIYRDVFQYLGLNFDQDLTLKSLEDIYTIYFDKERKLSFTRDEKRMKEQLEAFEPNSYSSYKSYIKTGYEYYRIAISKLLGRNYYSLWEFLNLANLLRMIRMKTYIRHSNYVKRFFRDPDLQRAFSFQNIYVGQSPYQAPAFFSMLPAVELTEGTVFPTEGIYGIVRKLKDTALKCGVKFYFHKTVEEILIEDKAVKGIKLVDGTVKEADLVVINADLPNAYRNLLPDKRKLRRLDKKRYSCSAFVFHWGIDKAFNKLGHHSIFLSAEYKFNLNKIFKDKMLAPDPSFYVHAPTRSDVSAAPQGMDTLSVIVPVGHISKKHHQPWDELKADARKSVLKRLEEFGMENIESHIKFEVCYTPVTWENSYRVEKGGVFGSLAHSIFQMGYFRPSNRHRMYNNLYFVGGSTHPGNGVPLVLLSAKLTSERILRENL